MATWSLAATCVMPTFAACARSTDALTQQPLAIVHATVIDGTSERPRGDQAIVVSENRIIAVGPASTTRVPAAARVVDGRGRYLIPGLWDMHVHTAIVGGRPLLGLYVANGVTGV